MKRALSILLVLLLLTPGIVVFAEESISTQTVVSLDDPEFYDFGDFRYIILDDGTAEITDWRGKTEELAVPAELDGVQVTVIGKGAISPGREPALTRLVFSEGITTLRRLSISCNTLQEIVIPDSLVSLEGNPFCEVGPKCEFHFSESHPVLEMREGMLFSKPDNRLLCCPQGNIPRKLVIPANTEIIEESVFWYSTEIRSVSFPDSLREIRQYAFTGCENLQSLTLPNSIKSIGWYAFGNCEHLKTVKLNEGLESIGPWVFQNCVRLEKINLPKTLKDFEANPFIGCTKLKTVTIAKNHPYLKMVKNVLFTKDGTTLLWYPCRLSASKYTIPKGTQIIAPDAFDGCRLRTVSIPGTVTTIGESAFAYSYNLNRVTLPDSVTSLGYGAFYLCNYMNRATLSANLIELPEMLFGGCERLKSVTLPEGIREIPKWCFSSCTSLEEINIPASVSVIGENAFGGCEKLRKVNLPEGLTEIKKEAFSGCKSLESLTIPASVRIIGKNAFILRDYSYRRESPMFIPLIVSRGSKAEAYCQENELEYSYIDEIVAN